MGETVSIGDQTEWVEKGLERLRYEYDLKPGEKCIDIGSYQREWANKMVGKYGVEVECFDALDNRAAWLFNGQMFFGGQFYYTSMYASEMTSTYKCFDIVEFLQEEIAVCKINIEGGEYELLDYIIESGAIKNIRELQVQFHYVEGWEIEKIYNALAERLKQTHALTWRYDFVWENWKRND